MNWAGSDVESPSWVRARQEQETSDSIRNTTCTVLAQCLSRPRPPPTTQRLHPEASVSTLDPLQSSIMSAQPPPPPQWALDLSSPPASKPKNLSIPNPPGYTASLTRKDRALSSKQSIRKAPTPEEMDTLKMKKAWEVAIAPAKQLPMNAIGTSHTALLFPLEHN